MTLDLRDTFRTKSNCWADVEPEFDPEMAMTEDRFVEVVGEMLEPLFKALKKFDSASRKLNKTYTEQMHNKNPDDEERVRWKLAEVGFPLAVGELAKEVRKLKEVKLENFERW